MGAELFRADGQTDKTKLTAAFRHYAKRAYKSSTLKVTEHEAFVATGSDECLQATACMNSKRVRSFGDLFCVNLQDIMQLIHCNTPKQEVSETLNICSESIRFIDRN